MIYLNIILYVTPNSRNCRVHKFGNVAAYFTESAKYHCRFHELGKLFSAECMNSPIFFIDFMKSAVSRIRRDIYTL